ncbi:MAG: hypothetical protein M5U22_20425 [Thermoleophilia bacterium]|nr:hypothetical protein [Thermoleophilia bacterium]
MQSALRWSGRALAILGLLFVVLRLRAYWHEIDLARLRWGGWTATGGLSLLYGTANVMLALAWWHLLRQFGAATSRRWAIRAYGLAQISKYVPGNIFHLAARQARGMAVGIPGWPLARSAAWELGLLAACGVLFGFLALPLLVGAMPVFLSAALFCAALGAVAFLLSWLLGTSAVKAFGWQAAFLLSSGLLFLGVLALLGASPVRDSGAWLPVLGAYIVAWLAGLVTPGSPAGLGVREVALLFLLKGLVPEAELIQAVVLARVVSVLGDGAFLLGALALLKEAPPEGR